MNQCDYKNAVKHFEKSSTYCNEYGLVFLGIFHLMGFGLSKRDPQKALECFKKSADDFSNRVAQYLIGIIYFTGDTGVQQDSKSGYDWLLKAANNGWYDAMAQIGFCYASGCFGENDTLKALPWFEKVVKNEDGNNHALIHNNMIYLFGQNEFEIDMSNESDSVISAANVILAEFIPSPIEFANQCFVEKPFSSKGNIYRVAFWDLMTNKKLTSVAACQSFMGMIYCTGDGNVAVDKKKAVYWLKRSAKNGNASAYRILGLMYENGDGVDQDYSEAMSWYMKSKEKGGDVEVLACIGELYYCGHGVKRDHVMALNYFNAYNMHAEKGEIYFMIGEIYKIGEYGVKKDLKKAFSMYSKASDLGHGSSATQLGLFYRIGFGVNKDETKSFEWLMKGAALDCPMAHFTLGQIHYDGYKGKHDHDKALDYFEKSLKNGFAPAALMVNQLKFQKSLQDLNI